MFEVAIEVWFSAAHSLRHYRGKCEELHGHNWKVEVTATREDLDKIGMVIDFKILKEKTREIMELLDHHYLNELQPFTEQNPSSENIARYLYGELRTALQEEKVKLSRVTVWESEGAKATYYE